MHLISISGCTSLSEKNEVYFCLVAYVNQENIIEVVSSIERFLRYKEKRLFIWVGPIAKK